MTRSQTLTAASLLFVVGVAGVQPAHASVKADNRVYVLIVANNQSLDKGVKPLRYADDDAVRYYELFSLVSQRVALFTVLDDKTARLHPNLSDKGRPPVANEIFATLKRWNAEMATRKAAGKRSELVFVYAGHGDVDSSGEGYVTLQKTKLRRRDLYQRVLAPSKADFVHLIIDACKSYFLVNRRGKEGEGKQDSKGWKNDKATDTHDAEISAFLKREELSSYPNAGVILATSGDQSTHEWTRYHGGILSHELRSALAGAADINGDGRVEYSEIHAFIAAANARVRHPEARLNIFAKPPAANRHRPLFDLRQAQRARLLRFDRRLAGRFHLEDDRGVRVADLHKAPGMRFDLAVDRRRAYFIRRDKGEARVLPGPKRVRIAQLTFGASKLAVRAGSLDRTFRRDLYRVAYSRGFYDGFCAQTGHVPVSGGAVEFVIRRQGDDEGSAKKRHQLTLGYIAGGALLDLVGLNHGLQISYGYELARYLTLGVIGQYGLSSHGEGTSAFSIHRLAMLANVAATLPFGSRVTLRAELAVGYQGIFSSGGTLTLAGKRIQGDDPVGLRLELGGGARVALFGPLFADVRGGLAVELVTIEPDEEVHTTAYGALALGVTF